MEVFGAGLGWLQFIREKNDGIPGILAYCPKGIAFAIPLGAIYIINSSYDEVFSCNFIIR